MPLFLRDVWPISDLTSYKVHFARRSSTVHPLEVWVRDKDEWQEWQEYRPKRDEFNRPRIFSLIQFYHEPDIWLFGGIFDVRARKHDRYEVELSKWGKEFIGRLKLKSSYRDRATRVNFENHYSTFEVQEILREAYSGRSFSGYEEIDISFQELESLVRNNRPDWKAALESVKGIYLITDTKTGRRYVGAAYGGQGIWSRWCAYVDTGHGGNVELRSLVTDPTLAYCRANFRFALLEHRSARTDDETVISREQFWKGILLTRGVSGLNRN